MLAAVLALGLIAAPTPIHPPAAPGSFAPDLARAGRGLLASWLEPHAGGHRLWVSGWDGRRWARPRLAHQGRGIWANWVDTPRVAVGYDGTEWLSWPERSGDGSYDYEVRLARAAPGGAFRALGVAHRDRRPAEHGFVSFVALGAEGMQAVWLDGRDTKAGGPTALFGAALDARGVGPDAVIDPRVCDCCATAAARSADGLVVAYRDRDEAEVRDISVVRKLKGRWTAPVRLGPDGWRIEGCPVNGPAIDALGRDVAVAWFTAPDGRAEVKLAFSEDGGAGFSAPIRVDAGPEVLGRVGLQLEREGTALVSWLAGRGEAVSWRLRRVRRDGSVGRPLTLARTVADRGAGVGRLARIEGGVAFAWTSSTAGVRVLGLASADVPRPTEAARRDAAPELSLGAVVVGYAARDLENREVRLEAARGRPVLVHRWATWCEPCVAELPNLARLHMETSAWLGWAAVAVDPHSERGRVRRFVAARRLPFPVWLDPEDRLAARLGGGALPTTYLLDAEGRLVWRHEGRLDPEDPELLRRLSALRGP